MSMEKTKRRSMSSARRQRIFDAHEGICGYCHEKITTNVAFEIDHATPLALGGADDDGPNSYPIHKTCHHAKTFGRTRDQKRFSDISNIAKTKRIRAKRLGKNKAKPGSPKSRLVKKIDGSVVRRDGSEGRMK